MRQKIYIFAAAFVLAASTAAAQKNAALRELTVVTEPNAVVFISDVNYGRTDAAGRLSLKTHASGAHQIRVRADGFKEAAQNLSPAQRGELKIALVKTTDEAELAFQRAEREKDLEALRRAIALRPKYPEAHLALARALLEAGETDKALKAIQAARRARPVYPEASAVEGRIYKTLDEEEKAVAAFRRALKEGKGYQPEAYTGIALIYKERAENARLESDYESEKANYLEAAKNFSAAAEQLAGAPDAVVIYQFLGDSYEKAEMYKEAIRVYEDFLRKFPDSSEASVMRSFIVQINKKLKGEQ